MKITVLTLFPDMIVGFLKESIVKRAQDKGLVEIEIVNIRDFSENSYHTVDEKPYGGGVGMVMKVDIVWKAVASVIASKAKQSPEIATSPTAPRNDMKVIITTPKGELYQQEKAKEFSKLDHLVILAGHYEGVDERVLDFVDEEVSLGDFVMTGGEITAVAIVDAVVRLIPGVLKQQEATTVESFFMVSVDELLGVVGQHPLLTRLKAQDVSQVQLLEYPQYTRPEDFNGKKVPEVLLSGNHKEIEKWRMQKAFEETIKKRPDLLE